MLNWLEPGIMKRISEITAECLYDTYVLSEKVGSIDELHIEFVINKVTIMVVEKAYRSGLDDGLDIGKKLK